MKIKMSQLRRIIREELSRQRGVDEAKLSWIGSEDPKYAQSYDPGPQRESLKTQLTFSSWANSKGLNFTDVPPGAAFFQIDEINRVVYGLNKQRMQVWKAEIPAPGGEAKSFQRMPLEIDTLVARHKYGGN